MTAARTRQPVRRVRPFTPAQEAAALLSERTVGRDAVLNTLDQRLFDAASGKSRAHTLLIGPRGAGKTHLLRVAIHRAQRRPEVTERLAFVRFDEDAVGISRYTDILAEALAQLLPATAGGRRFGQSDRPEGEVADALGDRVLVLVIENLDRVFNALGKSGQQDFRAWVETTGQVMVLATAPLLFKGVKDRAMPWWGNFGIVQLDELDLAQGQELLIRLANESGDSDLAEFLASEKGESRLRALNALAGGSPRIWMILSECLTVELLDELVPAVEALLEGLVPYYQQLLWDLSPVEQRLVRILADGPRQAATVAELAEAAGIQPRVAATTLGRLVDVRWVRAEKAPELDKRSTWYRLQEPMVRHHFHYRAATDQPLPLIVEILKAWFDPNQRRAHLALAQAGSEVERLMAAALKTEPALLDLVLDARSPEALLVEARRWVHGQNSESRNAEAGLLIDIAVSGVLIGADTATDIADRRRTDLQDAHVIDLLLQRLCGQDPEGEANDRVSELLALAADQTTGRTHAVLGLISASWDGPSDAEGSLRRLLDLQRLPLGIDDQLRLDLYRAAGRWASEVSNGSEALKQAELLEEQAIRVLGPTHQVSLQATADIAYWTGLNGDPAAGRKKFQDLVALLETLDSPDHGELLLTSKFYAAISAGGAGDVVVARDELVPVSQLYCDHWGPEDYRSLLVKVGLADWIGLAGDSAAACDLAASVITALAGARLDPRIASPLRAVASETMQANLSKLLAASSPEPVGSVTDTGIVGLLQAAVAGSAEALVRVPSELVPIVESIREQREAIEA
jgi:hypothetical protein